MKRPRPIRPFLAGMLTMMLIVSMIPAALALAGKTIQVYTGINVYVNDQKIEPKDANGNPVEAFVYNGTTYLPIRAIGNALGIPVAYDPATTSAYLGKHASETPSAWLSQMDFFSGTEDRYFYTATTEKDNLGNSHIHCITRNFNREYILNGQYSHIAGVLYQSYDQRSASIDDNINGDVYAGVYIYGDGELLYCYEFTKGSTGIKPVPFNVDLTGVLELGVWFYANQDNMLSLGDVGLYT